MGRVTIQPEQHCEQTSKLCYPTEEAALQRGRVLQRADPKRRERYAYQCDACGQWHMTMYRQYRPLYEDGSTPRTGPKGPSS